MTETKRTAKQIRAYCEAAEKALKNATGGNIQGRSDLYVDLGIVAATDLPRVLEAAEHRGLALRRILVNCDDLEIVKAWATNALADTAWLEEDTDGST